eukprot:5187590-Pleurochrysis_carterae.AAC.5
MSTLRKKQQTHAARVNARTRGSIGACRETRFVAAAVAMVAWLHPLRQQCYQVVFISHVCASSKYKQQWRHYDPACMTLHQESGDTLPMRSTQNFIKSSSK